MDKKNTGKLGRYCEMVATLWLLRQGYEVFDNVSPNGPIDLIAVHPSTGEVIKIDVKKLSVSGRKYVAGAVRRTDLGVVLLYVHGDECYWTKEAALEAFNS